ncbi:MAG: hypothetical protein E6H75_00385 [Betaproteobacteria bacterium]|nr:MAG: hypothetical protein E6H75_00385 [Betaproteobacteria bacterium]
MKLSNFYLIRSVSLKWRRICRVAREFATSPIIAGCRRAVVAIRAAAFALLLGAALPLAAQTDTVNYLSVIPGVAGYGMQTPAGRGGAVYKVTNLNASGAGSFRACTDASGPRVCVFEVSGNIDLGGGSINVYNPFLTIAGQTAPAPGISIINGSFTIDTHDVLVQHIRVRGGLAPGRVLPLNVDNYLGTAYNVVIDHVSMAWSTDDLVMTWWGAHDVTWTHVLATGELRNTAVYVDTDGKVMLTDSIDYNILMRASALITGYQRMPFAQANPFVFVNNIVYNWGGVGTQFARQRVASGGEFIMDNNHYKMGPLNSQAWSPKPILLRDFWVPGVHIYLNGNYAPDWAISQQWDLVDNRTATPSYSQADLQVFTPGAWPAGLVARSAANGGIFDWVLNDVGAFPLSRDSLDARLVNDARNRTGGYISSTTFPTLAQNSRALTLPANPNGDDNGNGYTNLEEWLQCMAAQVEGRPCSTAAAPSVPANLAVTVVSSSEIDLSWSAATDNVGVSGYGVYRAGALLATLGAVTTYQDTGLTAYTTYSYTVQAIDAAGNASAQSASASATTQAAPDTAAPSIPTGLAGIAVSSNQIDLSWNPSTDNVGVVGYAVYLNDVMLATTTATSFQHTGLAAGTTYNYRVSAYDAVPNNSAWTATPVSVTMPAATPTLALGITAPSAPTGLLASAVSSSQIDLSWTASTDVGVTGYRVHRGGVLLATVGAVTAYQNAGLSASTTYFYTVQAFDAAGDASIQSASAIATTQAAPDTQAPSVPTGLTGTAVSPTQINLTWNASTDNVGVAGYTVYLNNVALAITAATSFQHTGLTPGTTYKYRVSAYDAVPNNSAWTARAVWVKTPGRRLIRSDFNGDGTSDILWRNSATGENTIWFMNGTTVSSSAIFSTVPDANWSIAGVGDFNGDGKPDILWHDSAAGQNVIWLMNGATISSGATFATVADLNWSIAGVGDFDGDGKSDILWRNSVTGENAVWLMNGATISRGTAFAGIGDFDGDGKSDILWRHSVTGQNVIWLMNGTTILSGTAFSAITDLNWSIVGVGDLDGDGMSDILWRNSATGENAVWFMNGTTVSSSPIFSTVPDSNWSIAGVGDLNGDGKSDILWHNSVTGENAVWLMNGATISAGTAISPVPGSGWSITLR